MKKTIIILIVLIVLFIIPLQLRTSPEVDDCTIMIPIADSKTPIPLEQYVLGVINGEMPASFHIEALKAQAIAARTYAIYQTNYGQTPIKTTTAHQVFKQQIDPKYEEKLQQAVSETANQILMYDNEPITAMFHAASNGQTETAENYGGSEVHYLQSVPSGEQYVDTITMTLQQLNQLLQSQFQLLHLKQSNMTRNTTNRVEQITIHNQTFTGREFREKLSLKSTDFSLSIASDNNIHITTRGYGHGVGMSQYGANERAHNKQTASQILQHYYPQTTLETMSCTKNDV